MKDFKLFFKPKIQIHSHFVYLLVREKCVVFTVFASLSSHPRSYIILYRGENGTLCACGAMSVPLMALGAGINGLHLT